MFDRTSNAHAFGQDWLVGLFSRVPGALMIVPLLLGAACNTFFPQFLALGGFTTGLFRDGVPALIGLFMFCMGAQIRLGAAGKTLEKGAAIMLGKLAAGVAVGLAVAFGMPDGTLFGLLPVAIIAAMTNSNGALFVALTEQFGNKTDKGAVSVISINDGPFFTLVALGVSGLAQFPIHMLLGVLVPLVMGFVLGNVSPATRRFLAPGETLMIPFMAVAVGAGIDFRALLVAGAPGVLLGVMTVVVSGGGAMGLLYLLHRFHRSPPAQRNLIAGACEATSAGNAVATPAAVALADPSYHAVQAIATAQVAGAVVTTTVLVPVFVLLVARWQARRGIRPATEYTMHWRPEPTEPRDAVRDRPISHP